MKSEKSHNEIIKDYQDFKAFFRYYKKTIIRKRINSQKAKFYTAILLMMLFSLLVAGTKTIISVRNSLTLGKAESWGEKQPIREEYELTIKDFLTNAKSKLSLETSIKNLYLTDFINKKYDYYEVKFSETYNDYYEAVYVDQELYDKLKAESFGGGRDEMLKTYKRNTSYDRDDAKELREYFLEHTTFEKIDRDSEILEKAGNKYLIGCFDTIDCVLVGNISTGEKYTAKTKYYHNVDIEKGDFVHFYQEFIGKTCIFTLGRKNENQDFEGELGSLNELLIIANSKHTYYEIEYIDNKKILIINFRAETRNKQFGIYKEQLENMVIKTVLYNYQGIETSRVVLDYDKVVGLFAE